MGTNLVIQSKTGTAASNWDQGIHRVKQHAGLESAVSQDQQINEEQLQQAVQKVNDTIKFRNTSLKVEWNNETNRKIVSVLDTVTGEVLKEIPAKDFVKWEEAYAELLGMLFDEKI